MVRLVPPPTMNERPEDVREIKLQKESEFRFELEAGAPIAMRVCSKSVPKHCQLKFVLV